MKFGVIFDVHISDTPPRSRKDDYKESILKKLEFVVEQANENKYSAILMLGDLFHKKIPSYNSHALICDLLSVFGKSKVPIYIIAGNHDIHGNLESLESQPLNVLLQAGVLRLLDNYEPVIFTEGDFICSVNGKSYRTIMESAEGLSEYTLNHKEDANVKVSMFHQMILPDNETFVADFVKFGELQNINADIILDGHYHKGFNPSVQECYNKYFINGGALSRGTSEQYNLEKDPEYIELELSKGENGERYKFSYKEIQVPHKPKEEVFNLEDIELRKEKKKFKDFIGGLNELEVQQLKSVDPSEILKNLETIGLPLQLESLAKSYLENAKDKVDV